jgi:hypothetical protein
MTNHTQPALMPGMGLAFGGVQYRPMDTGKGGWEMFQTPAANENGEQASFLDIVEAAYLDNEYGDCANLINHP